MTIVYCDRCGAAIHNKLPALTYPCYEIYVREPPFDGMAKVDLCYNCLEQFQYWMHKKSEGEDKSNG